MYTLRYFVAQIYEKLYQDQSWLALTDWHRLALRKFIQKIHLTLGEYLDKPVTTQTMLEAKNVFLSDLQHKGFIEAIREEIEFDGEDPDEKALAQIESNLTGCLEAIDQLISRTEREEKDLMTEIDQLRRYGLSEENIALFLMDRLKIKDLLTSQPGLIIMSGRCDYDNEE